jgi:hypothetical protein
MQVRIPIIATILIILAIASRRSADSPALGAASSSQAQCDDFGFAPAIRLTAIATSCGS